MADVVVLDIDTADSDVTALASLLVSYHKTYWMTKYNNELYGKLSTNRIFDLQWLRDEIGERS
jgi:hypothetical protein